MVLIRRNASETKAGIKDTSIPEAYTFVESYRYLENRFLNFTATPRAGTA
jgi:hypothetical protein